MQNQKVLYIFKQKLGSPHSTCETISPKICHVCAKKAAAADSSTAGDTSACHHEHLWFPNRFAFRLLQMGLMLMVKWLKIFIHFPLCHLVANPHVRNRWKPSQLQITWIYLLVRKKGNILNIQNTIMFPIFRDIMQETCSTDCCMYIQNRTVITFSECVAC